MFKCEFTTENAAFRDDNGNYDDCYEGAEICRILKRIESDICNGNAISGNIVDANGNVIGKWSRQ